MLALGNEKAKSKVVKATVNPQWEQELHLACKDGLVQGQQLMMSVKDYNRFTMDDPMGDCVVDVSSLEANVAQALTLTLQNVPTGTLEVELTWVPSGSEQSPSKQSRSRFASLACPFDRFFSCERGTTPRHLLQHGVYRAIASQLRAAPLRVASLVQLVRRMAEADAPVRTPNEAMRQRQLQVIARIQGVQLQRASHAGYPVEKNTLARTRGGCHLPCLCSAGLRGCSPDGRPQPRITHTYRHLPRA
jgi:hypothetical protein